MPRQEKDSPRIRPRPSYQKPGESQKNEPTCTANDKDSQSLARPKDVEVLSGAVTLTRVTFSIPRERAYWLSRVALPVRRDILSGRIAGKENVASAYAELWESYVLFYIDKSEVQDFLRMDDPILRKETARKRGKAIVKAAAWSGMAQKAKKT